MKLTQQPAVTAAGLSCICCLVWAGPLISPYHLWIYHDSGAASAVFVPVLLTMALLWLAFTLLLLALRPGRIRTVVWSCLIFFTPWLLLKDVVLLCGWRFPHWLSVAIFTLSCLCWIAVIALWRSSFIPVFERVQDFSGAMFAVAALGGVMVTGQLFWYLWEARSIESPRALHSAADHAATGVAGQKPRIVWIILDELSYQQVFERRFPSLDLPAFDQLAGQSTVFTHVEPAASYTEVAVPSLLTGQPVDRIRAGADGTLQALHDPDNGQWQPFHSQNTVFADALNRGYGTAVAGWFNPYCRVLSEVLDRCQWTFRPQTDAGMASRSSIMLNMRVPWTLLFHVILRHGPGSGKAEELGAMEHLADYRDIVTTGDRFLQDSSINFMLLHVPVPHPGGIYDRRTKTFATHQASYIDNLALADSYLAHVREVLEQRGEWDSSAIVVMGDHSWRTKLIWRGSPFWTAEDEVASHGGEFDDRPGYIVKLPHQTAGARIESTFPAVRTRALLDGILDGTIRTPAELAAFAGQGAPPVAASTRVADAGMRSRGR